MLTGISMHQTLSKSDLFDMIYDEHCEIVRDLAESLKVFAGKGSDKKPMITKGLKLKHKKSGLTYTVIGLQKSPDDKLEIVCEKPQGGIKIISSNEFKDYERL